ncbi:MAG: iron-sulfur cluster assembly scaffold protein [Planctomycetota bacterium]|nr:iron-sulfur cluster assembly scaffold protein [Planctomycetota bacterium]
MVSEALRALLQRGEGVGEIEGANTGAAEHPVCGDRMQLSVLVEDGVVRRVCWRASGCPASMAVAALCSEVLVDVPVDDAARALVDGIAARGGLRRHEQHAEKMALRALREALGR